MAEFDFDREFERLKRLSSKGDYDGLINQMSGCSHYLFNARDKENTSRLLESSFILQESKVLNALRVKDQASIDSGIAFRKKGGPEKDYVPTNIELLGFTVERLDRAIEILKLIPQELLKRQYPSVFERYEALLQIREDAEHQRAVLKHIKRQTTFIGKM